MNRHGLLFSRYGDRMTLQQVADDMGASLQTLYNSRAKGALPFKAYRIPPTRKLVVDTIDYAKYIDQCKRKGD